MTAGTPNSSRENCMDGCARSQSWTQQSWSSTTNSRDAQGTHSTPQKTPNAHSLGRLHSRRSSCPQETAQEGFTLLEEWSLPLTSPHTATPHTPIIRHSSPPPCCMERGMQMLFTYHGRKRVLTIVPPWTLKTVVF